MTSEDGSTTGTGIGDAHRTQRLGAYAVVVRDPGELLLTQISARGYPATAWALPGGGVDHGESPHDAVRRELYEETAQQARTVRLVDIHSLHIVDHGRDDRYEDYHGVHVLYAVDILPGVEPRVMEVDGTTEQARWVPIDEIPGLWTLPVVDYVLERLDDYR